MDAVLRLEYPVVLVGEVEHLAGNAEALRGRECGDALRVHRAMLRSSVINKTVSAITCSPRVSCCYLQFSRTTLAGSASRDVGLVGMVLIG